MWVSHTGGRDPVARAISAAAQAVHLLIHEHGQDGTRASLTNVFTAKPKDWPDVSVKVRQVITDA